MEKMTDITKHITSHVKLNSKLKDIWSNDNFYTFLKTPSNLTVTSSKKNEHAKSIIIQGLNQNWELIKEKVLLNTFSKNKFIRVNRVHVDEITTMNSCNIGNLSITNDENKTIAYIPSQTGSSDSSLFTIPLGYTGFLNEFSINSDNNSKVNIYYCKNALSFIPCRKLLTKLNIHNQYNRNFHNPISFSEKTDIWAEASSPISTNLNFHYSITLIKN